MPTITTLIKVYVERYRHVPERILPNKDGRYQELQELIYTVVHEPDTSPEEEAIRLIEALKLGRMVRPRYYTIVALPDWKAVEATRTVDT